MAETNQQNLKPGYKTSEFWITLLTTVAGILVATGHLTPIQADEFVQAVISVVGGATTIAATVAYLYGRMELKRPITIISNQIEEVPAKTLQADSIDIPPVYPK